MPDKGFQGKRLTQARKVRTMTQKALAQLIGKTSQTVSQYESDTITPPAEVVEQISKVLQVPVELLYRPWQEHGSTKPVFYRSMSAATKKARDAAESKLEWIDDCVTYFEGMLDLPEYVPIDIEMPDDPLLITDDMIEDAAAAVREAWDVPEGPVDNMIGLLERHGIFVFMMPLGADTLDALSVDWNEAHPYVIIGTDQGNACRWRFDCAHELGHLVLHQNIDEKTLATPAMSKLIETQAHRFASAFLMPEQEFVESLYTVSLEGYRELKPYWKTSIAAMVRRTKDLGIISEDGYRNLYISISRRKWRKVEPFDEEMAPERPALAKKCLDVISNSMVGSEDEFMKMTALPDDFMMTLFGGYRRIPRANQGSVLQWPMKRR